MQQNIRPVSVTAPAVLGIVLVVLGTLALFARATGLELFDVVGRWGWPMFVIAPGLVLLVASLFPERPAGIAFAIPGAIITTVGLVLEYQSTTGRWESWAFAWALIPASVGLALLLYGLYAGRGAMVRGGLWLAGIMGSIFVVAASFFEGLFAGEVRGMPLDWWPIALIILGGMVVAGAFVRQGSTAPDPNAPTPDPTAPPT